jgi:hypothetical protein
VRSPQLVLLLVATTVALGAGPKKPPPNEDETPSWEPQPDSNQDDDPCPTTPPYGWRLEVGYATSKKAGEALAAAQEKARTQLLDKACAGVSELRCTSIARHIAPWKNGHWDKKQQSACHAMAIEETVLKQYEKEIEQLRANLSHLATSTVTRNGGVLLSIEPPTWASGCIAGDLGASIANRLRNHIGKHASNTRLVPQGSKNPRANSLRITLTPTSDRVTVSAGLHLAGKEVALPLPGFDFRIDLFNVQPDEVGACRGDEALGLKDGERLGKGGLRVIVEVPTKDGLVCEGATVEPKIQVNQPAKVQVYSVGRDGTSYAIWPPPGGNGLVNDEVSLGETQMVSMPDQGDETLVAIAVPATGSFGLTEGWTGFCKVKGSFGPMSYPEDAAVGASTYMVLPNGARGCPNIPPIDKTQLEQALQYAPLCGG